MVVVPSSSVRTMRAGWPGVFTSLSESLHAGSPCNFTNASGWEMRWATFSTGPPVLHSRKVPASGSAMRTLRRSLDWPSLSSQHPMEVSMRVLPEESRALRVRVTP